MRGGVAPVLVAAFGNPMAGDDAVGHRVALRIRARPMEGVEVVELATRPMDLVLHLAGRKMLLIVDAVWIAGERPGRIVDMDWFGPERPLLAVEKAGGTHSMSVAHAVALAERLALLPPAVRVLGLTVRRPELGRPLTGVVRRSVRDLAHRIEQRAAGAATGDRPPRPLHAPPCSHVWNDEPPAMWKSRTRKSNCTNQPRSTTPTARKVLS